MTTAIRTENLSKIYRLGEIGTGTISHDLGRWWAKMRGKEDPFLKIGQTNDRTVKGKSDIVYSLRNINFEIQQGEAVGIIGKNGAGKSTLLKILSRVTSPTTGKINIKGRVASLLEVGTGFHPELTGRENIYLNGAILGMRKKEITSKLDEIIDFSGVERYIDTPVKRYSSGMYVRLAFAVAAHLESEILIVDEVLAVGDAEFQKKCLGKMNDVSKGEGRTVLFVSHNMAAVQNLCNKGILLTNGFVDFIGGVGNCVTTYNNIFQNMNNKSIHFDYSKKILIQKIEAFSKNQKLNNFGIVLLGDDILLELHIQVQDDIYDLSIALDINNINDEFYSHITNEDDGLFIKRLYKGQNFKFEILLNQINFIPGQYYINLWIGSGHLISFYKIEKCIIFNLEQSNFTLRTKQLPIHSKVFIKSKWNHTEI